jgi:hypothetical protein
MAEEIASLYARIGADVTGFRRGMNDVHGGLLGMRSPLSMVSGLIKNTFLVGAGMVAGFGAALVGATVKAAGMEQNVADIGAAMNLTADETKQVKDLIKNLSLDPKLKVNSEEAAAAIDMLGRNGLTLTDIMGGAARSTVLLANATGGDMALSADIATSAMQAFGLTTEQLDGLMSNISGTLVASKFDINDYGLALAQAGGMAGAVGVSIEDFNATIAAISPLFQSGSDAGTSFKTFLQRMVPDTSSAGEAFRELGLFTGLTADEFARAEKDIAKLDEKIAKLDPTSKNYATTLAELTLKQDVLKASLVSGQNAFFNADGSMKSMAEVAGLLQNSLAGLTEEQKIATLTNAFGTDAMRAAIGMANVGSTAFTNLKNVIGETNAEDQAAKRMDTLSGSWDIFRGIIDANVIALGDELLPVARQLIDWAIEWVTKYQPKIDAAFASFGDWLRGLVNGFTEVSDEGTRFGYELGQTIRKEFTEISKYLGNTNLTLDGVSEWFTSKKGSVIDGAKQIADAFIAVADGIKAVKEWWDKAKGGFDRFEQTVGGANAAGLATREWLISLFGGRAGGGPASGMTLVGERGPELVNLPVGSYVNSNSASQNMARGGTTIQIANVNLQSSGTGGGDLAQAVTFLSTMYGYGYN